MSTALTLQLRSGRRAIRLPGALLATGDDVPGALAAAPAGRVLVHLAGFPDLLVWLDPTPSVADLGRLRARVGESVLARFPEGQTLRLRVRAVHEGAVAAPPLTGVPLDLTAGRPGAAPLWLHPDGRLSDRPDAVPEGLDAGPALVTAARWISGRRSTAFERLFPPDPFHPERPARVERLEPAQAEVLLAQVQGVIQASRLTDSPAAAQARSAALTVLSHLVATGGNSREHRAVGAAAAEAMFAFVDAELGPGARGALRAHAVHLLQLRGPALSAEQRTRAQALVRGLLRAAPPYDELAGPLRFAMCSAWDFHEGECAILVDTHGFTEIEPPADAPRAPTRFGHGYRVFEAPFRGRDGAAVQVFARVAAPDDENLEMGEPGFVGLLVNRHAQLGAYDMRAAGTSVEQRGYKLLMNSQCAGLTTRFAIARLFPDADLYSSWDSTYFRTDGAKGAGKVVASEGVDCFVALLRGFAAGEDHARLSERMRRVQWNHSQEWIDRGFVQFVGPAHPLVVRRFDDVNRDGRADHYDGFLDFELRLIAEDLRASATPRDPGVAATQLSGAAADGLNWAAGSLNRVTQYSELWAGLPDKTELFYPFSAGGFYSHREPPTDVAVGAVREELDRLPALVRYTGGRAGADLHGECLLHAWLAHTGKELKRLLVAAEALNRAFDLGLLAASGDLATPLGRRAMLLLTLAGLLDFPADQNFVDGLWSTALRMLNLPDVSRSFVRACITEADHDASNYYGSRRGVRQLVGQIEAGDPVLRARLSDPDPAVGRALPLEVA